MQKRSAITTLEQLNKEIQQHVRSWDSKIQKLYIKTN